MAAPTVIITKLDAARRQLETAIRIYFHEGDVVALHTLTGAAHEVLYDLCSKMKIKSFVKDPTFVKPEKKKEYLGMIGRSENFFKHADRDPHAQLNFNPQESEMLLLDACMLYKALTADQPFLLRTFHVWATIQYPELFSLEGDNRKRAENMKATISSRQEFIRLASTNEGGRVF